MPRKVTLSNYRGVQNGVQPKQQTYSVGRKKLTLDMLSTTIAGVTRTQPHALTYTHRRTLASLLFTGTKDTSPQTDTTLRCVAVTQPGREAEQYTTVASIVITMCMRGQYQKSTRCQRSTAARGGDTCLARRNLAGIGQNGRR